MLVFLGCSTQLTFLPEIAQYPAPPQVLIRGKIIYEGSPEYLPGTMGEARDNVDARIVVKYTLDESRTRADHVAVGSDTYKFKFRVLLGHSYRREGMEHRCNFGSLGS